MVMGKEGRTRELKHSDKLKEFQIAQITLKDKSSNAVPDRGKRQHDSMCPLHPEEPCTCGSVD